MGGAPFSAHATLTFPKQDEIAGEAPGNRYFNALGLLDPALYAGPIGGTRMGTAEATFLASLEAANAAELTDANLILSGPESPQLVFTATD